MNQSEQLAELGTPPEAPQQSTTPYYPQALPPDAYVAENGNLYREVKKEVGEGVNMRVVTERRKVSLDIAEARLRRMDFYHHKYGWLIDGFKHTRNRDPQEIMNDGSQPAGKPMEV